jgi:Listeria-Bacteroides repeat domain (List_Bact_rpt)
MSWTVTYDPNGGTGTPPKDPNTYNATNNLVTVLDPGTLTRTPDTFARWNTAADGTGTSYSPSNQLTIASNLTL